MVFDHEQFIHQYFGKNLPPHAWFYTRFQKIAVDPHDPDRIYIGARWEGGYHWSDDGGDTWHQKWLSGIFRRVDTFVFHPVNPDIIYAGTHHQGMFASYNRGRSWISLSRGLAPERRTPFYGAYLISGLVLTPGMPEVMYTSSDHSNWKTIDSGVTWREMDGGLTCEFARTMAVDPVHPQTVYAGTNIGVYKSENGGDRWRPVSRSVGAPADSLHYDHRTGKLTLFTSEGPYHSSDGGLHWDPHRMPEYAPVISKAVSAPEPAGVSDGDAWAIAIHLDGDAFFEDSLVDTLYRRPPYIALQLVSPGYPLDGSAPVWSGNFSRYLRGTIRIPGKAYKSGAEYLLYAEVRDFQRNTLKGFARVTAGSDGEVGITLSPETVLPCFGEPNSSNR